MSEDPFSLLGLPRQFEIDQLALQRAYLRKAARTHPDRAGDAVSRSEAAAESAKLNQARSTLADDEARANALLALLGGPAKEHDKSLPDGFLMEILEVRQQLEEAHAAGDEAGRASLEDWARSQRAEYASFAGKLFRRYAAEPDPAILRDIRRQLNAWRYIERMIEQLRQS